MIEEQAKSLGDRVAVTMTTGERLTYRELRDDAARVAGMLAAAGASAGDRIVVMLPSGLDFLRAWAGIGRLSSTAVILNRELTGSFLEEERYAEQWTNECCEAGSSVMMGASWMSSVAAARPRDLRCRAVRCGASRSIASGNTRSPFDGAVSLMRTSLHQQRRQEC